jgi:hypothetical protein
MTPAMQKNVEKISGIIQAYGHQLAKTAPRTQVVWHKWGFTCIDTRRRQQLKEQAEKRKQRRLEKATQKGER